MAAGLVPVCVMFFVLFWFRVASVRDWNIGIGGLSARPLKLTRAILVGVFAYSVLALAVNTGSDLERALQTYAFLAVYLLGAAACALNAAKLSSASIDRAVRVTFWLLVACAVAGVVKVSPLFPSDDYPKAVLAFAEPSHFALAALPFVLYVVVCSKLIGRLLLLTGFCLAAVLLENMTLVVGAVLAVAMVIRLRWAPVLVAAVVLLSVSVSVDSIEKLEYFLVRAQISDPNASTLTYMDGWERAYLNTVDSFGVGAGFQQFGIVGRSGEVEEDFSRLGIENQNAKDGSIVGAKLVGEFGVVGVLLLVAYLLHWLNTARRLRSVSSGSSSDVDARHIFVACCYVAFIVDLFVRGTGYFSSTGFLFMASVMTMGMAPILSADPSSPLKGTVAQSARDDILG